MPSLKDLSCSIEISGDQEPLQEFGTVYGDAFVETFITVPKEQQTFTIHLSSKNFIAPGIAMYVFIDGVYQCNRNRQNLKPRQPPDRRSLVDFRVRQKEEIQKDGSMIAREWTFEKLDHASADGPPHWHSPNLLQNDGCIEIIVLRCAGSRNAKTPANMNLDGATDYSGHRFDRDRRSRTTTWDDRGPFFSVGSNVNGPPPPVPTYHSPYAETVRSHQGVTTQHQRGSSYGRNLSPFAPRRAHSRFSEPVSPGTHPRRDIPAPGFQYGSGPLPPHRGGETHQELVNEARPAPIVDPALLEEIVRDAVKRGVEQSRKQDTPDGSRKDSRRYEHGIDNSSQMPGAWLASPTRPEDRQSQRSALSANYNRDYGRNDPDSIRERHSSDQKRRPTRSRAGTRVTWEEDVGWDKQSRADGWGSADNHPVDSWDIEDTWSQKPPGDWEEVGRRFRSRTTPRRASHAWKGISSRRGSSHDHSQKPRSRPHAQKSQWPEDMRSSSEDNDGWTHVEALSDSTTSLERSDSTLKPSHSRSQVHPSRGKSARRSSQRDSSRHGHERGTAQLINNPQWHAENAHYARSPSVLVTNAPTVPFVPSPSHPTTVQLRKQSAWTQPTVPIVAPPPAWGYASKTARDPSGAATYLLPAPFSTVGRKHAGSRGSSDSSSWGFARKGKTGARGQSTWSADETTKKPTSSWGGAEHSDDWDEPRATGIGTGWGSGGGDGGGSGGGEQDGEGWGTVDGNDRHRNHDSNDDDNEEDGRNRNQPRLYHNAPASVSNPNPNPNPNPGPNPKQYHFSPSPNRPTAQQNKTTYHHHHHNSILSAGTPYGHLVHRPLYLDDLGKPYAVFRFKYRGCGGFRKAGVAEQKERKGSEGTEGEGGGDAGGWTEEWVERYL
ncbi:uncharacterized protein EKO05_0002042 [Ascochyta rabiei]|uniref:Uncharacterized protein n=1 Tax=Didymella rabiei TaxID=5454 RepID=A0A163LQS8_DIDRA|nr:uncharacterized protein EKO05_0002042 [Ascochyta rabiei]KZM28022.1 hypothetical protein ST47_g836 [Ascochyta rabiei]UPX11436.1 hypothetical protein EKO05_0002042 [Ascochyta rabiei]